MFERFTDRARKVLTWANEEAVRLNQDHVGTEHLLLGLIAQSPGVAMTVLKDLGIDPRTVRGEVEKLMIRGSTATIVGKLPQTPSAQRVIELAIHEARGFNHSYVGTEHVLLGLVGEQNGVAARVLTALGLQIDRVRATVTEVLGVGRPPASPTEPLDPLESYKDDPTVKHLLRFLETYKAEMQSAAGVGDHNRVAKLQKLLSDLDATIDQFHHRLRED